MIGMVVNATRPATAAAISTSRTKASCVPGIPRLERVTCAATVSSISTTKATAKSMLAQVDFLAALYVGTATAVINLARRATDHHANKCTKGAKWQSHQDPSDNGATDRGRRNRAPPATCAPRRMTISPCRMPPTHLRATWAMTRLTALRCYRHYTLLSIGGRIKRFFAMPMIAAVSLTYQGNVRMYKTDVARKVTRTGRDDPTCLRPSASIVPPPASLYERQKVRLFLPYPGHSKRRTNIRQFFTAGPQYYGHSTR